MTTHELRIEGMSCNHCVKTVDQALRKVAGVKDVAVEIGKARVQTDDATSKAALVEALSKVDYEAS